MSTENQRIPCAYIPHGGGPLPLLGDKEHKNMVTFLESFVTKFLSNMQPKSCLVISAHWEESQPTILNGNSPNLYYDYYGFPKESYSIKYPIKPSVQLIERVSELLKSKNIPHKFDDERGYDHGVFIPLKIMLPNADIPIVQLSLVKGLDAEQHIKLGEALTGLRDEGVLIIGSGMSYHNMRGFGGAQADLHSVPFHEFLRDVLVKEPSYEEKVNKLSRWSDAPSARQCHPREEHLIPLMCCLGAAKNQGGSANEVFFDDVIGVKCAGYIFP